jgi:hypothetical protein
MTDVVIKMKIVDGEADCNLAIADHATHITTEVLMKALVNMAKEIGSQFHADKPEAIRDFLKDVIDGRATVVPEHTTFH